MNYIEADNLLQGRNNLSRKVANNTYLVRNSGVPGDKIHLKLHNTYIISWLADGRIELNTGGWHTVTTRARINDYLEGFYLSQKRGQWFVCNLAHNPLAMFADGMTILPDGELEGAEPLSNNASKLQLRRKVQSYASSYIDAFIRGEVPKPGPGDCFYCLMRSQDGETLGESSHNAEHILSHLEESYFVPSLLHRAFEVMPHSAVMGWAIAEKWAPESFGSEHVSSFVQGFVVSQLKKMLGRYILRQIGQA